MRFYTSKTMRVTPHATSTGIHHFYYDDEKTFIFFLLPRLFNAIRDEWITFKRRKKICSTGRLLICFDVLVQVPFDLLFLCCVRLTEFVP